MRCAGLTGVLIPSPEGLREPVRASEDRAVRWPRGPWRGTAYTRPDILWFARWNNLATVADDTYISPGNWTNHQ
ncbi:hypothetical protein, partial [Streptomyces sp. NPDC060188]|uniref:hypothetical protein n=1 Tax=Streptomyces sp. NPDC060188 TaxID=3347068 RepID=UPI00364C98D1